MTGDEYLALRKGLGLRGIEAAELFGVHRDTEISWARGKARVPAPVSLLLRYITFDEDPAVVGARLALVREIAMASQGRRVDG